MHVALQHLEVFGVAHEVRVHLQDQTGDQSGALSEYVGHVYSKDEVVAHLDYDGLGCEGSPELVAQREVVDEVRKCEENA